MLRTRLITAAIVLPALVYYILKLPQDYVIGLLAFMAALTLHELYTMYKVPRTLKYMGILAGIAVVVCWRWGLEVEALAVSFIVISSIRMLFNGESKGAMLQLGPVIIGLVYIALMMTFQLGLYHKEAGLLLYLYGTIWAGDASAYFIGTKFGKHKLYKATWLLNLSFCAYKILRRGQLSRNNHKNYVAVGASQLP